MINREQLAAEHAEIDAMAVELLAIVERDRGANDDVASIRWKLNRHLMVHLAKEDSHIYPMLVNLSDVRVARLAAAFQSEMGGLAKTYLAYNAEWDASAIAADWPGFCKATRQIMNALRRRIRREERDLYPLVPRRADRIAANG